MHSKPKQMGYRTAAITISSTLVFSGLATAATVKVTVENLAPVRGFFVSQLWVGFHDGTFDVFNPGEPAPEFLERLAEDAIVNSTGPFTETISTAFANSNPGGTQGIILGTTGPFRVFDSGDRTSGIFTLDSTNNQYFSYGAMGLPSNDAFIANGNPLAFKIFEDNGRFTGADFIVTGTQVWDAGAEVNDEIPTNTAALAQAAPNTGQAENGLVRLHPGFLVNGNILAARPNADFTQPNYSIVRIQVTQVAEPSVTVGLMVVGGMVLLSRRLYRHLR